MAQCLFHSFLCHYADANTSEVLLRNAQFINAVKTADQCSENHSLFSSLSFTFSLQKQIHQTNNQNKLKCPLNTKYQTDQIRTQITRSIAENSNVK